jgi:hypothetical protein
MSKLEKLLPNASVQGILPNCLLSVVSTRWFGSEAHELAYKDPTEKVGNERLYRHDEPRFKIIEEGRPWSLDGAGALFRLVSEAQRIRLAHLFDPLLAVHTLVVDPLPHQIAAVYDAMLPRQPLRFLLADDPGAGKMKELMTRGDLQRCLVVCPEYVPEEFNRAEALENDKRAGTVGFALTILQRRLESLHRRRERLESRLRELELLQRGGAVGLPETATASLALDEEDVEDLEDTPENEIEEAEGTILDRATAARTVAELKTEIAILKGLESLALTIRRSGEDKKWRELANLLTEIFTPAAFVNELAESEQAPHGPDVARPARSPSQKLFIFTEHRDTLNYWRGRIATLFGREGSIVTIHGGLAREGRRRIQARSASAGRLRPMRRAKASILQHAHLMVNYKR